MATRTRTIPFGGPVNGRFRRDHVDYINPARSFWESESSDNPSIPLYLSGGQITDSISHPEWHSRKRGVAFSKDYGGPFESRRWYAKAYNTADAHLTRVSRDQPTEAYPNGSIEEVANYHGPYLPLNPSQYRWPSWQASSDDALNEAGTTAIALCSPSNPSVDLTTALGEIVSEGIPSIIGSTFRKWRGLSDRDRRRAIGEEYLNYQFGWVPFLNDFRDLARTIVTADLIFKQYQRDSGKMVRRGYDFPLEESSVVGIPSIGTSPWCHPITSNLINPGTINMGQVDYVEKTIVRKWFRGAFTYYVPPADSLRNAMAVASIQARKVLGISLTPDTVWNLTPWSWAIDWFSNSGDLLSNWTDWAIDNQVLLYGYIMEHTLRERTYTFVGETGFLPSNLRPTDVTLVVETKKRRQASPYGFGLDWEDLTPRQQAIVAALGISRSR